MICYEEQSIRNKHGTSGKKNNWWSKCLLWQQKMKRCDWNVKVRGIESKFLTQKSSILHALKLWGVIDHVWKRKDLMETNRLKMQKICVFWSLQSEARKSEKPTDELECLKNSRVISRVDYITIDKNQKCIKSFNSLL